MTKFEPSVEIIEFYKDYEPPINATAVTQKLIDNIPQNYLLGLRQIVITNRSGLPRRELRRKVKSRKRKISMDRVQGFYHHRTGSSPAWIEIFIDQISYLQYGIYQKVPFLRERAFADILYHEIGHHIHTVIEPEHREREDVAEEWEAKLWWHYYLKKKYWYLLPFLRLLGKLIRSKVYQRLYQKFTEDLIESHKKSLAEQGKEKSS